MNSTNSSSPIETYEYQKKELNLFYVVCEVLVAVFAVIGNALVIFVFRKERRLRRRTNYYIVSLAAADFLVGLLGIPFAIMSSMGLPSNLHACLFTVSLLVVLCTISIFCLVAVSVDRYWAILHPMGYSRNVRTKTAIVIISICWVMGTIIGFLPLLGWHKDAPSDGRCFFLDVMDYNYLVFLYFGTIITPALLLAAFYAHIYQVVLKQLRRIVTINPETGRSTNGTTSGGTMLRMLGAAQKREVKATQNLSIIVLFFMICWIPLYTINCTLAFCRDCHVDSTFMFSAIILSHLNSAGNPLLYAYHLKDFRAALKNFFCNLFGYPEQIQPHNRMSLASNNNYNHYRLRMIAEKKLANNSQIYYRNKPIELKLKPQISTIIKNSASLAVATAGEAPREIWNIPEASSDSSESPSRHHEKTAMVRPATPYRPHRTSDVSQVNHAYLDSSSVEEEEDDVFVADTFPFAEFKYSDCDLMEKVRRDVKMVPTSTSSPQLAIKGLYFIESDFMYGTKPIGRSCSLAERNVGDNSESNSTKCKGKTSPVRVLKNRRSLGRSLSDEGTVSNDSIVRKSNGAIARTLRGSCGS